MTPPIGFVDTDAITHFLAIFGHYIEKVAPLALLGCADDLQVKSGVHVHRYRYRHRFDSSATL